jgi:hypothetical protein
MNALIRATSEWLRLSSSDNSIIHTRDLHRGVFASQIGEFVGEVNASQRPQCRRLPDPLRAFENQAAIGLCPRPEYSSDGGDEPA